MRRAAYPLLLSCLLAMSFPPAAASSGTVPNRVRGTVRVLDCNGKKPELRPSIFILSCATGELHVSRIRWTSWTSKSAHGLGTLNVDLCRPDCASGKWKRTESHIVLTDPVSTPGGPLFTRGFISGLHPPNFSLPTARKQFVNPDPIYPVPPLKFNGWWYDAGNSATVSLDLIVSGRAIVGSGYFGPAIGSCTGPPAAVVTVSGRIVTKTTAEMKMMSPRVLASQTTLVATGILSHAPGRLTLRLEFADGTTFYLTAASVPVVHSFDRESENCGG